MKFFNITMLNSETLKNIASDLLREVTRLSGLSQSEKNKKQSAAIEKEIRMLSATLQQILKVINHCNQ